MALVAVSFDFQKCWTTFFSRSLHCTAHTFVHCFSAHSVDHVGRHFVRISQLIDISDVGSSSYRSTQCVVVVLANKYNRQFPKHCQVKCFVENSLSCRTITKECE